MDESKKVYFISDLHLGAPDDASSRRREILLVRWLDEVATKDAAAIYFLGDVFDFWFEYAAVVPKGFVRFLGKIASLTDQGIKITFFRGNHDMWMFDYLSKEIGVSIVDDALVVTHFGKRCYLHHGDGLGTKDAGYRLLKKIFRSPISQFLFRWIHPNIGFAIAQGWSRGSRKHSSRAVESESNSLLPYSHALAAKEGCDYLFFGHLHHATSVQLSPKSTYVNLGAWLNDTPYAVLDATGLSLKAFLKS